MARNGKKVESKAERIAKLKVQLAALKLEEERLRKQEEELKYLVAKFKRAAEICKAREAAEKEAADKAQNPSQAA